MADFVPFLFTALAFGAVAAVVFVVGQYYSTQGQMQRRLPASIQSSDIASGPARQGVHAFIARNFQDTRFGVSATLRERLRRELLRAGYFSPEAVNSYIVARVACVVALPTLVYVFSQLFPTGTPWFLQVAVVAIAVLVAIAGPDAYLARRRRLLVWQYRLIFPDFLDLLVVCVDAGLTLDAAFARVRNEIAKRSRELGMNLELMGAEMRAGRSMIEALNSLADRLNLDEAGSFVSMLRQSIELGSDVGEALRVFSDEMRDKRLLRAEEAANKLTVKMVLPLGLFIFPVVLLVVMLPVMIKLLAVLK
jgi:tight adherence protein C